MNIISKLIHKEIWQLLLLLNIFVSFNAMAFDVQFSQLTETQFEHLPVDQQKIVASNWLLDISDIKHYLWIMQNTPNGWYYADKHLDPSLILGINADNDNDREKFALIAIKNERKRIEGELAFQRVFSEQAHKLFPAEFPISYSALTDKN